MKKILLSIFTILCMSLSSNAQIPNAGFESWTNNGEYEMLDDYFTSNELYFGIGVFFGLTYPSSVNKVSGRTSGFAVAIKNVTETADFSGEVTDTLPGFAALWESGASSEGIGFTQRPTALTGYYKFNQGAPGGSLTKDTARIYIILGKSNGADVDSDSIGGGALNIYQTTSGWTAFTIPIGYINGSTPDSLFFGFMSSLQVEDDPFIDQDTIHPETELIIDDIALTGVTGQKIPLFAKGVQTYPNPATDYINIKNIPQGASLIEIVDHTGAKVKSVNVSSGFETINTANLSAGLYHYSIIDAGGELMFASMISIAK